MDFLTFAYAALVTLMDLFPAQRHLERPVAILDMVVSSPLTSRS